MTLRGPDANDECFPSQRYDQRFSVPFEYPVYFTHDLFNAENPLVEKVLDRLNEARRHRALVYVDSGVAEAHPKLVQSVKNYFHNRPKTLELTSSPDIIPGGEAAKRSWDLVKDIMWTIGNHHLDRHSFIIAIGGGSVLDAVGFATSLVHRGLRIVRVPTTVLAQNDAGVGVKNGMDEHGAKNYVGTFAPPFAVINDYDFLPTLADRDWVGGIAEAFKVAIIKEASLLDFLCENASKLRARDQHVMEELVYRTAILHLEHIRTSGDPFEMGEARPLDFGHWAGHKLEAMSDYQIGHGQAVAVGIAIDLYYAMRQNLIAADDLERILAAMTACGLPIWDNLLDERTRDGVLVVLDGLNQFREHLGGTLNVTLPDGIGAKVEVHQVYADVVAEALHLSQEEIGAMRLQDDPPLHLTYCLNVHPGETWDENFAAIREHALVVKREVSPDARFGLGLRLSNHAARQLVDENRLSVFAAFLHANDLYVFTINGFPYGTFHGTAVKSDVYKPDWRTTERRAYTDLLADILAELLPEGVTGSISTVPGSYNDWVQTDDDRRQMTEMLTDCARHLADIRTRTGKDICLALEPEPDCFIENTDEAVAFFADIPDETFRRHVGICVDVCHLAVAFEDPAESIRRMTDAGVRVAKVQLSSAIRCTATRESLAALRAFCDPVYLHQVRVRTARGEIISYADLSEALDARADANACDDEWRVHFHVPLFLSEYGVLESTRSLYTPALLRLLTGGITEHLEIETYTFDVLPEAAREPDVTSSIAREYEWVLSALKS